MKRLFPLVIIIFFISGACGLVYEVVWLKMLSLVFGVTALAAATTLASFMAGLGLGSYYFGRMSDYAQRPLRLYGFLELGVASFAFLMPLIFGMLDNVYVFLYREVTTDFFWLSVARLFLSFSVLLIPTFLMGGTLPVISRFLIRRSGELGKRVSQLYFINTLGAVLGTSLAGFFLIYSLGVLEAAYLAGLFNAAVAVTALLLDRRQIGSVRNEAPVREPQRSESPGNGFPGASGKPRLVLWAIGISGFCSLSYEVLWTRVLVYILDNTAQAFTTMLIAFLLGIALGSLIVSRWLDTGKRLFLIFGAAEVAIGLFALLSIPVFANVSAGIGATGGTVVYPTDNQALWAAIRLVRSLTVMLVPTLLMGMTVPVATRIFSSHTSSTGGAVGRVYAANTAGGVIGAFAAGLVLLPVVGVYGSVLLVACINAVVGLALVMNKGFALPLNRIKAASAMALPVIVTLVLLIVQGRVIFSSAVERIIPYDLLYYREGSAATVKVYQDAFAAKSISIDGFPVAGTTTRHLDAQKSLGHLPLLLSPVEEPGLNIVGFGAGGSSFAATLYDTAFIDVVELIPDVIEGARLIPEVNHGVMDDPRVNIVFGDGRNYLLLTGQTYDIISVDATSPKSAGSGSLYSREFYESCKSHLSADGLMVEWLPYHIMTEYDVKMVARTFQEVFPHATLWYSFTRHYYLLVGTQQELAVNLAQVDRRLSRPEVQQELAPLGIHDAYDVLACLLMGEEGLRRYAGSGLINTDDHPRLEYDPSSTYLNVEDHVRQNLNATRLLRENASLFIADFGGADPQDVRRRLAERIAATPLDIFWPQYIE